MARAYLDVRRCISGMERAIRTPDGRDPRRRRCWSSRWPRQAGPWWHSPLASPVWPSVADGRSAMTDPEYGLDAGPGYSVADCVGDVRAICQAGDRQGDVG